MKNILYILIIAGLLLSAVNIANAQSPQNTISTEPEKTGENELVKAKQPFIYRIESENPNEKLMIALSKEDIAKIEDNITQYEKQKNINDRANKVYILNPTFEITSVVVPEK